MKTLEINGKRYDLPESLDDIRFSDYVGIFQGISGKDDDAVEDKISVISKVLREDRETVETLPLEAFNIIFSELCWLFDEPGTKASDSITIDGWTYTITPIEKWPLRKYIESEEAAKGGDSNYTTLLATILTDNDGYNTEKAKELAVKLSETPASKVAPLIAFFLHCRRLSGVNTLLSSIVDDLGGIANEARSQGR